MDFLLLSCWLLVFLVIAPVRDGSPWLTFEDDVPDGGPLASGEPEVCCRGGKPPPGSPGPPGSPVGRAAAISG